MKYCMRIHLCVSALTDPNQAPCIDVPLVIVKRQGTAAYRIIYQHIYPFGA